MLSHSSFGGFVIVGAEVVHEQGNLGLRVGSSEVGQVLQELGRVDGELEDLAVLDAILLGDPS